MHAIRVGLLLFAFGLIVTFRGWGTVAVSQSIERVGIADMLTTRTVKVIPPSIARFSHFEDGLKFRIRDRIDWVRYVKTRSHHKEIASQGDRDAQS